MRGPCQGVFQVSSLYNWLDDEGTDLVGSERGPGLEEKIGVQV